MAYMRLGDLLVASGVITQEQLEQALKLQKQTKQRLGDVLIQSGVITEQHLIEALQIQLGVEFVDLTAVSIPVELVEVCAQEYRKEVLRGAGEAGKGRAVPCNERPLGLCGAGGG